eukprot:3590602-Rhodomonas_salina.6
MLAYLRHCHVLHPAEPVAIVSSGNGMPSVLDQTSEEVVLADLYPLNPAAGLLQADLHCRMLSSAPDRTLV